MPILVTVVILKPSFSAASCIFVLNNERTSLKKEPLRLRILQNLVQADLKRSIVLTGPDSILMEISWLIMFWSER